MALLRVPGGWVDPALDLSRLGWDGLLAAPIGMVAVLADGAVLFGNDTLFALVDQPAEARFAPGWSSVFPAVGETHRQQEAVVRRDGSTRMLDLTATGFQLPDGRHAALTIAVDVTAVRTLEAQVATTIDELRARNIELASLDRLKSQLLANVSHELRTPLVSIKGYTELILSGALGPLTPRQRRGLEIAGSNTSRLVELIETLLDFAQREQGRLTLQRVRLDARLPVREAVAQLAERIASRGIRLIVEVDPQPLEVDGDHGRLVQLMKVLIANAEKFSEGPEGTIRVSARRDPAGHDVVLEVGDTGIGIPVAARHKIFDRFYQVDASATRRFGGAGLGLALAKEIASLHGGEIRVDSAEGLGSTFAVRLPPSLNIQAERGRSEQPVVLVGAPEAVWSQLRTPLEAAGFALLHAETAGDTARRARRHRPDAVVLALGGAAITEVLDGLRADLDTAAIPVVAVLDPSARPEVAGRLTSFTASAELSRRESRVDYAVAPGDTSGLMAVLSRLLLDADVAHSDAPACIAVVDDEAENLDFTSFLLAREGYHVTSFTSGQAALATVDERCDLVILDLAMEGIDGLEVCRRLKAEPRTARVPVVVVTAMTGEEIRRSCFAAGADGFIVKPFGLADFLRQVRRHLRAAQPVKSLDMPQPKE